MDDQVSRKRRTGPLCSKKEILLSRSLGAENSSGRKSTVDEVLFVQVISNSDGSSATNAAAGTPTFLSYTDQERERDEEILNRFDREIGFDYKQAIALSDLSISPKKCKTLANPSEEEPNSTPSDDIEPQDIIELESISSNNPNIRLHSSETSSEFIVSESSKTSPPRHRIKNTIPGDTFERYLTSLRKNFPPMTERDRVLFWNYSPDNSNTESLNDLFDTAEISSSPKKIFTSENNNDKPCSSSKDCNVESAANESIILTINTTTKQMYKPEALASSDNKSSTASSLNLIWSGDNSDFKLNRINREIDKPPKKVYGNARQMKQKMNASDAKESPLFKVPNIPISAVKFLASKTDTSRKEEFYKYLGLGTIFPNGKNEIVPERDVKRRSLRVRRLQIQHDPKKIKAIGCVDDVQGDNSSADEDEAIKDNAVRTPSPTPIVDDCANSSEHNFHEHYNDRLNMESLRSQISSPNLRRTCGSIISSVSSNASSGSQSTKVTNIIEKFDYTNSRVASPKTSPPPLLTDSEKSILISNHTYRKTRSNKTTGDTTKTSNGALRRITRLKRKNGLKTNDTIIDEKSEITEKPTSNETTPESVDSWKWDAIAADIRNRYKNYTKEPTPTIISCIDRITYEKPLLENEIDILNKSETNEINIFNKSESVDESANIIETAATNSESNDLSDEISTTEEPEIIAEFLTTDENLANMNTTEFMTTEEEPIILINFLHVENPPDMTDLATAWDEVETTTDQTVDLTKSLIDASISLENCELEQSPATIKISKPKLPNRRTLKLNKKRRTVKVLQSTALNSTMLRSKRILKIMASKLRIRKRKKQKTLKTLSNSDTDKAVNSSATKLLKLDTTDPVELYAVNMTMSPVPYPTETTVSPVPEPIIIAPTLLPSVESIQVQEETKAPNLLPNPLERAAGCVLHAFYEQDFLIVIQQFKISFWKYSKVIKMFAKSHNWELLGEHERKLNDSEVKSPYKNRLCVNETNPVYVEMRARQFPDDMARECNMASVYVNVYYFDEWKATVVLHSVHLDTIRGLLTDISYTTVTNSRYFIMCWKQESISNITRTGICKYSLTPDLDTLASIREFKNMRHFISQLECLSDDKLIGFGDTQVTIWDHMTGDVLTNFDFETMIGHNLGSVYCSIEFKDYLMLYQKRINETTQDPQLIILAVNLSENSFRLIYTHNLSTSFSTIKSSLSTNDLLITTAKDECELLLLPQQPHRLFYCNNHAKSNMERFYSAGSQNFVEISDDNLIVKTIHEFLIDFVK